MPLTAVILGAGGRLGQAASEAFVAAGHEVRAVTRDGRIVAQGAQAVAADAADAGALLRAAEGADVVFNGLNLPYPEWEAKALPLLRNVLEACAASGARHLFPGNVYVYGSPMPPELSETEAFSPSARKGRIRVQMETLLREQAEAGKVRSVILRAGDFYGQGTGSMFDLIVASKVKKGIFTAPGPMEIVHEWAYLPDLAQAFVRLAEAEGLGAFETLNFSGHAVTGYVLHETMQQASRRPLKVKPFPWGLISLAGPFVPMLRELTEMRYLYTEPHRLLPGRLEHLIGEVPYTRFPEAIKRALAAL